MNAGELTEDQRRRDLCEVNARAVRDAGGTPPPYRFAADVADACLSVPGFQLDQLQRHLPVSLPECVRGTYETLAVRVATDLLFAVSQAWAAVHPRQPGRAGRLGARR